MLKLDFSIVSSDDRSQFVNQFFTDNPDYKPTQNELDTISNYILYGKDADGTSVVDRGEVEIETKYGSYAKRKAESLDELMETPGFNENTIVSKYIYRHPKQSIDREADADIPGMKELWQAIDRLAYVLDVYAGKTEVDPTQPAIPVYTQTDLYKLKHHLIDMRKQQYVLKDTHKSTEHTFNPNVHKASTAAAPSPSEIDWDSYWFYPLGLRTMPQDGRFDNPFDYAATLTPWDRLQRLDDPALRNRNVIDFTNADHIYLLAKQYQDLSIAGEQDPDGLGTAIIDTLDFYAARAQLVDSRQEIWDLKCAQWANSAIRDRVNEKFGTSYNENYISTLFKQNICGDIAEAARLHADYFLNRDDTMAWKICTCCGERKLRDAREFMRKSKSSDGLASRCKRCESKVRAERKAAKAAQA